MTGWTKHFKWQVKQWLTGKEDIVIMNVTLITFHLTSVRHTSPIPQNNYTFKDIVINLLKFTLWVQLLTYILWQECENGTL